MTDRIKEMMNGDSEMKDLGKILKEEKVIQKNVGLDIVKKIQTLHPHIIITGSTALYLHGVRLARWREGESDLDLISPHYTRLESSEEDDLWFETEEKPRGRSNNDKEIDDEMSFDFYSFVNGRGYDFRVDPKEPYEMVEHDDFSYKIAKLENIWMAKLYYAKQGNRKHRDDFYEAMGKKVVEKKKKKPTPKPKYDWSNYGGS